MSGHHGQIEAWRRQQRLRLTAECRPDVLEAVRARGALSPKDEAFLRDQPGQVQRSKP
jgi:tRNA (guanine37-N1)-methyltransferase